MLFEIVVVLELRGFIRSGTWEHVSGGNWSATQLDFMVKEKTGIGLGWRVMEEHVCLLLGGIESR